MDRDGVRYKVAVKGMENIEDEELVEPWIYEKTRWLIPCKSFCKLVPNVNSKTYSIKDLGRTIVI